MKLYLAAIAAVPLVLFTPSKAPAAWGDWRPFKTDTGCIFYKQIFAISEAEYNLWNKYKWTGSPCQSGQPINGYGTLTAVGNLKYTTGKPGTGYNYYEGRMIHGVFDGPVNHSDKYGKSSSDYGKDDYVMGCWLKDIATGKCTPRN